jgi:hypothetical protein
MRMMKNYWKVLMFVASTAFVTGCSNNDEIKVDPKAEFDAILAADETTAPKPNTDVNWTTGTGTTIKAKVSFKSSTKSMKRLYITRNIQGLGETPYKPAESVDLKDDGSIDLTGKDDKNFEFQFTLPISGTITVGTIVYKFWTTTGNGDFRDATKRVAVGPGTITVKYGAATNPAAGTAAVKSYTDVKLVAPLGDGTSKTFVSLADGQTYNVAQGVEFVSLWDFGYIYSVGTSDAASLNSPNNYGARYSPIVVIDIPAKSGTTNDELHKTYFKKSDKTVADFDAVATAADLDFVSVDKVDANLFVTKLTADTIVEFVDQYGKKGLIKVLEVKGTNTADSYIRIAIKAQP